MLALSTFTSHFVDSQHILYKVQTLIRNRESNTMKYSKVANQTKTTRKQHIGIATRKKGENKNLENKGIISWCSITQIVGRKDCRVRRLGFAAVNVRRWKCSSMSGHELQQIWLIPPFCTLLFPVFLQKLHHHHFLSLCLLCRSECMCVKMVVWCREENREGEYVDMMNTTMGTKMDWQSNFWVMWAQCIHHKPMAVVVLWINWIVLKKKRESIG